MNGREAPCDIETSARILTTLCENGWPPDDETSDVSWSPLSASNPTGYHGTAYHGADRLVVVCAQMRARHGARCWQEDEPLVGHHESAALPHALLSDGTVVRPSDGVSVTPARAQASVHALISRLVLADIAAQRYGATRQATYDNGSGVVLIPTRTQWGESAEDLTSLVLAYARSLAQGETEPKARLAVALAATFALSDLNDTLGDAVSIPTVLSAIRPQSTPIDPVSLARAATLAEDVAQRILSSLRQLIAAPIVLRSRESGGEPEPASEAQQRGQSAPTPDRRAYTLGESMAAARRVAQILDSANGYRP